MKLIHDTTASPVLETCSARYLSEADILASLAAATSHPPSQNYILSVLCRTGRIAPITVGQKVIYKLVNSRQQTTDVVGVDDVDRGVLQLQASLELLAAQTAAAEQRIASEAAAVKAGLRAGSRMRARACLQRQKRAERRLAELLQQQANLEAVYEEILHAETNNQVVR
jgi:Snf7